MASTNAITPQVNDHRNPSSSSLSFCSEGNGNQDKYKPLYKAAFYGDWEAANEFITLHPEALTASLTTLGGRALHVATMSGHEKFVEQLVKQIPEEELELTNVDGGTAFHDAARAGIVKIAECMYEKREGLICIPTREGLLPVVCASKYGHRKMVRYLYDKTPKPELCPEKGYSGATLLTNSILSDDYEFALAVLRDNPQLAFAQDQQRITALTMLGQRPSAFKSGSGLSFWQRWIYSRIPVRKSSGGCPSEIQGDIEKPHEGQSSRLNVINHLFDQMHGFVSDLIVVVPCIKHIHDTKLKHLQALELLHLILESLSDISTLEKARASTAIFTAVKHGIVEFVDEMIKFHPFFIWRRDEDGRGIFSNAVMNRQERIYSLLYGLGALKTRLAARLDNSRNNMLHLCGKLAPPDRLDRVSGAALQLQRELQWFKEVEGMVQPSYRESTNKQRKAPRILFTKQHQGLVKAGEKWMKDTATSCMVVSTLIATVMFAAAFTIPGGNDQNTGIPLLLHLTSAKVFIISDALSLFSSSTSVLMFLAILTSRYAEEDFLKSLPQKLIIGLSTLFFSIATMMIAFGAAVVTSVTHQLPWVTIPISLLACLPVSLFAILQFGLLVDIFLSTYGAGIFSKKTRRWS